MNNMRFIARYAALAAIVAGVSSQAAAQQLCPITTQCPPPQQGGITVKKTTDVSFDTTGQDKVPFGNGAPFVTLSVPKFDKATYAALESTTEDKITLVGVELQLQLNITEILVQVDSNFGAECPIDWQYNLNAFIGANAGLGTPQVGLSSPISKSDAFNLPPQSGGAPPPWDYEWTLTADGGGPQSATACYTQTAGLANWIASAGNTTADFQLFSTAGFTFADPICGNSAENHENEGNAVVRVRYHYCVESTTPPPSGCDCELPSPHYRRPGSLLLFPEFDNREGDVSIITITNTDCTGAGGSDIDVEFIYIDGDDCSEFNKTETLTPCDTLTLLTNFHNPNHEQGYVYVFAKDENGEPVVWNHLIGNLLIVSGLEAFDYGLNPVVFRGLGTTDGTEAAAGSPTDLDNDGIRDLDAREYEPAPNSITIPRFLGQDGNSNGFHSQLILIGLTGGARFDTNVCFLFWNDNEEQFSAEYTFHCWDKPYLDDISFGFRNSFLQTTDHDPAEIIGAPSRESGWICLEGCLATSAQETIENPAIYAALVERIGTFGVADLPFECGTRTNGALLPLSILGDGDPTPVNGDNQ
ncbi:MAG: hypothetical protein H6828_01725 [Planctomycetes bacterium]|nr:hypothetical protein [Planctomycetota bacterium]